MKKTVLLLIVIMLSFSLFCEVYYVPADFPTIQGALNFEELENGDEIEVSTGSYEENILIERDISITLRSSVINNQYQTYNTILCGSNSDSDIIFINRDNVNSALITIAGFTISHQEGIMGRGINILSDTCENLCTVIIESCIISYNEIVNGDGGGINIYNDDIENVLTGNITLSNCILSNNSSLNGGGLSIVNSKDSISLSNCEISHNSANYIESSGGTGGGIRIYNLLRVLPDQDNTLNIHNCEISNNNCSDNGAGFSLSHVTVETEISNCQIQNNNSSLAGGLFLVYAGQVNHTERFVIEDCAFYNNIAELTECNFGNSGGAITSELSCFSIIDCEFISNQTRGSGGAISAGSSQLSIQSTEFHNNYAGESGGGIYFCRKESGDGCIVHISEVEFTGNIAGYEPYYSSGTGGAIGCGVYGRVRQFYAENLTASGNQSLGLSSSGGGIALNGFGEDDIVEISNSTISNNLSEKSGGGLNLNGFSQAEISNLIINNNSIISISEGYDYNGAGLNLHGIEICYVDTCEISGNEIIIENGINIPENASGGGVYVTLSSMFMDGCKINENSNLYGSGIGFGYNEETHICQVENSLITGNIQNEYSEFPTGAIFISGSQTVEFTNCTIADNETDETGVGGIETNGNTADGINIMNCILWGNAGEQYNDLITHITYSDLEEASISGLGNINLDPAFNEPLDIEYGLKYYSPCINTGNPLEDYDDPDGTRSDMGCRYHEHDVYTWACNTQKRIYLWRSFPRLKFESHIDINDGRDLPVDRVLETWNPVPGGLTVWYNTREDLNGFYNSINSIWTWAPYDYLMNSTKGYKMRREEANGGILFSRGLLCHPEVEVHTEANQESWLGYFLESSQPVLSAFPQEVLDDALAIFTMDWAISRNSTSDPWSGSPEDCKINYMDCVAIKTLNNSRDFCWNTPARDGEPEYRPVAEHFEFEDDIEYLPVYVEFAEDDLPQEIAIYVDDECRGAQVVEDTICQVCAHILEEEAGEEIEFAFWYEGRSSEERKTNYLVENSVTGEYIQGKLFTGMPGIHYKVSFKSDWLETSPIISSMYCYPNPFNPQITISFSSTTSRKGAARRQSESTEDIEISIYNIKGQQVKSFKIRNSKLKIQKVVWDGKDESGEQVSSGIYYIRLKEGQNVYTAKAVLMK